MREGEPKINFDDKDKPLEPRDLQILELLSANCSNSEIAAEFNLSPKYVKNLIQKIFEKFAVNNRQEAKEKYLKLYPQKE